MFQVQAAHAAYRVGPGRRCEEPGSAEEPEMTICDVWKLVDGAHIHFVLYRDADGYRFYVDGVLTQTYGVPK